LDPKAAGTAEPAAKLGGMKVVVAEDSVLLREGIARLLEDAGMEIVGQAGNGEELMLKVRSYKPDVAIVDIRMPPTQTDEGLRAAKEIREKHPETAVLDPSVVSQLVGRRRADDPVASLTPREREVLELMAEGLSNAAIAERMVVTERAVEKHVTSIFGKLRLGPDSEHHRRVLAVLAFLRA